jgi:hypothetical protein
MRSQAPIVGLGTRGIAFMADADWRLEYLGVETPDRLISLFQIMKIEQLALRWCAKNGGKVATLRLMLAGVCLVAVANPA